MFDNRASRLLEFLAKLPRGFKINYVVEGEFLALKLACIGNAHSGAIRVHGGALMRVLAITQVADLIERESQDLRKSSGLAWPCPRSGCTARRDHWISGGPETLVQ